MAKLKTLIDKLEEVDEALRENYEEIKEGKYKGKFALQTEKVDTFELVDTSGLTSALGKERQTVKDLNEKLGAYKDLPEPDEIRTAIDFHKKYDGQDLPTDEAITAKLENQKKTLQDAHNKALKTKDDEISLLMGDLEVALKDNAAVRALELHGGNAKTLKPHVVSRMRLERNPDSKKFITKILDENGNEAFDVEGNPLSLDKFVESMKKDPDFKPNFNGTGSSGADMDTSVKPRTGTNLGKFTMTREEARDVEKYQQLQAEASKVGEIVQVIG